MSSTQQRVQAQHKNAKDGEHGPSVVVQATEAAWGRTFAADKVPEQVIILQDTFAAGKVPEQVIIVPNTFAADKVPRQVIILQNTFAADKVPEQVIILQNTFAADKVPEQAIIVQNTCLTQQNATIPTYLVEGTTMNARTQQQGLLL